MNLVQGPSEVFVTSLQQQKHHCFPMPGPFQHWAAAVVVGALFIASTMSMVTTEHVNNDAYQCSTFNTSSTCKKQLRCEWCGIPGAVTGYCLDRSSGNRCCTVPNSTLSEYCGPEVTVCNNTEVCTNQPEPSNYDTLCVVAMCCPKHLPVPCGTACLPSTSQCCGYAGYPFCSNGTVCCGTEYTGVACCQPHTSQCCTSYDGLSHWCCSKDETCNPESGTCNSGSSSSMQ